MVDDVSGLVLSGGEGRRMGRLDKGLQHYQGQPLAQHAAHRLAQQVQAVAISANRYLAVYRTWGFPVVTDDESQRGRGPLAGMLAGLRACSTTWMACVPCDVPCFPADLVVRLYAATPGRQVVFASAQDDSTSDGLPRRHPTCCLLHRSLIEPLTDYLGNGGRRIDAWMRSLVHAEVVFDDAAAFANLNTLADLAALQADTGPERR